MPQIFKSFALSAAGVLGVHWMITGDLPIPRNLLNSFPLNLFTTDPYIKRELRLMRIASAQKPDETAFLKEVIESQRSFQENYIQGALETCSRGQTPVFAKERGRFVFAGSVEQLQSSEVQSNLIEGIYERCHRGNKEVIIAGGDETDCRAFWSLTNSILPSEK